MSGRKETIINAKEYFDLLTEYTPKIKKNPKRYSVSPEKINLKYKGAKNVKIKINQACLSFRFRAV